MDHVDFFNQFGASDRTWMGVPQDEHNVLDGQFGARQLAYVHGESLDFGSMTPTRGPRFPHNVLNETDESLILFPSGGTTTDTSSLFDRRHDTVPQHLFSHAGTTASSDYMSDDPFGSIGMLDQSIGSSSEPLGVSTPSQGGSHSSPVQALHGSGSDPVTATRPVSNHVQLLYDQFIRVMRSVEEKTQPAASGVSSHIAGAQAGEDMFGNFGSECVALREAARLLCTEFHIPASSMLAFLQSNGSIPPFSCARKLPNSWTLFQQMTPRPEALRDMSARNWSSLLQETWTHIKELATDESPTGSTDELVHNMRVWYAEAPGRLKKLSPDDWVNARHTVFEKAVLQFRDASATLERWGIECAVYLIKAMRQDAPQDSSTIVSSEPMRRALQYCLPPRHANLKQQQADLQTYLKFHNLKQEQLLDSKLAGGVHVLPTLTDMVEGPGLEWSSASINHAEDINAIRLRSDLWNDFRMFLVRHDLPDRYWALSYHLHKHRKRILGWPDACPRPLGTADAGRGKGPDHWKREQAVPMVRALQTNSLQIVDWSPEEKAEDWPAIIMPVDENGCDMPPESCQEVVRLSQEKFGEVPGDAIRLRTKKRPGTQEDGTQQAGARAPKKARASRTNGAGTQQAAAKKSRKSRTSRGSGL